MIASIKLELWFLDSAELCRLEKDEPLRGLGALVRVFAYLRRQHNAIGNKDSLSKVVSECKCDEEWLWRIITDYGLFVMSEDGSFYSPYQRQTLGMTAHPDDKSLRTHRRRRAPYSEDSKDSKNRENKDTASACVCLKDTQPHIGPSAYESVDRDGKRHGGHNELVPWWAPPQTDVYAMWSVIEERWVPLSHYSTKAECLQRSNMQPEDFMMKTAWEKLEESEHNRIQDDARRL
ncbi:hypothetical protein [Xylanibacter ruminicola]|uniref:Lin1244/Lin1753-like N-terminal domain-containing protein n=1 Tax=Xylanibacter ruminicola TaxID=839 RepID=A0A1M6W581_XYLRU|nr:hypothetical protein [Xylanibacter ruminicola]SHK88883.1 hypothetical protein SAMN05216463_11561 [Xylanibacter ruminicola]